ncbi:MAG: bifunctional (p)ppGpp synthetase/guanosine-3',5'-bis(diphosphate) 3'-pyrophosphohydrolase [Eubacterium aggregans]|uniref:GTP diphosphokinase n=1 Tax=Eubacterium aggregans TaxID=81409 RepID=A0A1H4A511_9FIRM|nr:bifunctional (p)ppGpp synthetase/guanosine-3',5'-bis(diphosphate) 3'-pyrophosphohydrolase [Eubacterium aggregans]MDD4690934.1 bifunctional (p)ppGpp synthetase/guanosine-3',5'-bis(diphosphate) 3'-pyrophosphohydrolase [Eubacterium aggregans]MEA5074303.1 bifunctional (p)ppGpp synthetase/guanosine-3',5'-bis(diphosphate) 3'-pyrophosphohydrolase [Eubacterium aggregans]SEA31193.1 GTP pyrophosphokinase [Eubacterium aggregans]
MANQAVSNKIDSVIKLIKQYDPAADTTMILRAFDLADKAHSGQKRKSGEDYIIHPVAVAYILAEYHMDVETIVAALLHDVIEDTIYTHDFIAEEFSETVAELVEGVTKIGKIEFQSKEENQAENLRKMVMAMSKDIRVILIKLVDRLHNMRTLEYMTPGKQQEKSRETMDIYAPIANRLGIQAIKAELEDLALKYLDPEAYYHLVKQVKMRKQVREEYIGKVIDVLKVKIGDVGIQAKIYGRAKHFYSIYRKMKAQHRQFDEIYDIVAVRVIVESVKDCYGVLGIVHTQWKPIPGRFKDYIAMPKPNMYQSIHTTVIGPNGEPFEIQIRTKEMHETAEYGIAAHWKYKEGMGESKGKELRYENKMSWLRQIMEWQSELDNAGDLLETIKVDLLNEEVYVFSPKGKVIELPMGSCPLDFAYRIHSDIGNSCVGAKVNNKIVPLNYTLNNGDIVEVMTSKNSNGPSRDWLNFVKSAHARNKIRQYFKREEKEENVSKGRLMLEAELKRQGLTDTKLASAAELEILSDKMGYKTINDFYAALGYNGVKMGTVFQKMRLLFPGEFPEEVEEVVIKKPTTKRKTTSNVVVAGQSDIDVHYSKCCNPVPGDKIIGYITQTNGISIHRTDCPNVLNITDPARIVTVEWNKFGVDGSFNAEIHIKAHEKRELLIELSKLFIEMNIPLNALTARNERGEYDFFEASFEVKSRRELNLLIKNINKIPEIITVKRV